MSRVVKRLCWTSLVMAAWLSGITLVGFLVAVKGPVGSAVIAFYSDPAGFGLDCHNDVSEVQISGEYIPLGREGEGEVYCRMRVHWMI